MADDWQRDEERDWRRREGAVCVIAQPVFKRLFREGDRVRCVCATGDNDMGDFVQVGDEDSRNSFPVFWWRLRPANRIKGE